MVSTDVTLNPPFSGKVRGSSMNLLGFLADIQTQPLHDQAQGGSTSILAFMPEISTGTRSGYFPFI